MIGIKPLYAAVLFSLVTAGSAQAQQSEPVSIEGGVVAGTTTEGIVAFKGIPYAAPPLGELRWAEPQPVLPWAGVHNAFEYSPACIPTTRRPEMGPVSENCLTLNVFTPAGRKAKSLPVIVWLHGGGFNDSSGGNDRYDGTALAHEGAVVVTFNYRLGILANLALPELTAQSPHHSSGALQALDQIAALRWVQKNIARFGGDPTRVLLAGQSSGSIAVSILQASPLAKGLFQRVIGMSGAGLMKTGAWPGFPLADAENQGRDFMESVGASSLAQLRAMPVEQLMAKAPFSLPVGVEGYVLPAHPSEIMAEGKQNDVPVIATFTRHEGFSALRQVTTLAAYHEVLKRLFDDKGEELFQLYPASNDLEAKNQALVLANEGEFGRQMALWAKLQSEHGRQPAYLGLFTEPSPGPVVNHGDDVPYWFGHVGNGKGGAAAYQASEGQLALSAKLRKLMVAFADTGVPETKGFSLAKFSDRNPQITVIGETVSYKPLSPGLIWFLEHPDISVGIGEKGFPMMTNQRVQQKR